MPARTALLVLILTCAACAEAPTVDPTARGAIQTELPTRAEIVCEADGSTTLGAAEIQVRRDGIALLVRSELDEPASLNGFGMDVDPGTTEVVAAVPPGTIEVACWPFSDHGSGDEPPTRTLTIRDPHDLFVPWELECPEGDSEWSSVIDYGAGAGSTFDDPVAAAREHLDDLEPGGIVRATDTLARAGYPAGPDGPVVLVRDGSTLASLFVSRGADGRWLVTGASGCRSIVG